MTDTEIIDKLSQIAAAELFSYSVVSDQLAWLNNNTVEYLTAIVDIDTYTDRRLLEINLLRAAVSLPPIERR